MVRLSQVEGVNPWMQIERLTAQTVPEWVKQAFVGPKLVTVPTGRSLYAVGPSDKTAMRWGAFEELDADWYDSGNQLDPDWLYRQHQGTCSDLRIPCETDETDTGNHG